VIGETSGLMYLRNSASVKADYEYTITITTTDGINDDVVTTGTQPLTVGCGAGSTTIGSPVLEPRYKIPNSPNMDIGGAFTSSNPSCPIYQYSISQ
jgi:hypothetical protein